WSTAGRLISGFHPYVGKGKPAPRHFGSPAPAQRRNAMRKFAFLTVAVGALIAFGALESPAFAAWGQCFDSYCRPFRPPHNPDNPPYGLNCQTYRVGGYCPHVQPGWAESNCGFTPRYRYYERGPRYWNRYDLYDYYDYYSR